MDYSIAGIHEFFQRPLCLLLLVGWSFSVFFHFCTGIRHLFWDVGIGFDVAVMTKTGWIAVITAVALTAVTWFIILLGV